MGKRPCDVDFDDMWAARHSLASLRISKPSFPWPRLAPLATQTIAAHSGPAQCRNPTTENSHFGRPRRLERQWLHPQPSARRQVWGVFRLTP